DPKEARIVIMDNDHLGPNTTRYFKERGDVEQFYSRQQFREEYIGGKEEFDAIDDETWEQFMDTWMAGAIENDYRFHVSEDDFTFIKEEMFGDDLRIENGRARIHKSLAPEGVDPHEGIVQLPRIGYKPPDYVPLHNFDADGVWNDYYTFIDERIPQLRAEGKLDMFPAEYDDAGITNFIYETLASPGIHKSPEVHNFSSRQIMDNFENRLGRKLTEQEEQLVESTVSLKRYLPGEVVLD
ncbi:unnamed protein product, partial [marine sediment metagenome]